MTTYNKQNTDMNKMISKLQTAANENDTFALNALATCYLDGDGVTRDFSEAMRLLKKAENLDSAAAKLALGQIYYDNDNVVYDKGKAKQYFLEGAQKGNVNAMFAYGIILCSDAEMNATEGIRWIRKAADLGSSQAQQFLVEEILTEVSPNDDQFYVDILMAADDNDPEALTCLGRTALDGEDGLPDYQKAYEFFTRAWYSESIDAAYNLGRLFLLKDSPYRDVQKAKEFFLYAADNGHVWAKEALALLSPDKEAQVLFRKAADLGATSASEFIRL